MRDDDEQAEVLRKWWAENGVAIVVAVVLSVSALLGWRAWNSHVEETASAASSQFQIMMESMAQARMLAESDAQAEQTRQRAMNIIEQWPGTAYANFSGFVLARMAIEQGDYSQAAEKLRDVLNDPASKAIRAEATIRLARVLIALQEYEEARSLLEKGVPAAWLGQAWELRGDMHVAQQQYEQARSAYESALENMNPGEPGRELVQMKLNDIAAS